MHTDNRAVKTRTDLSNGQRRGVGSEYAVCLADSAQLFEGLFFDLHVLDCCLNYEIAVAADSLNAGMDSGKDLVCILFCHLSFCYSLLKVLGNFQFAVGSKLFVNITQAYFISIYLGKCLSDSGTHGSCTNNTNFHDKSS